MAKKNMCPVCITKMQLHPDGHTYICPECGYKLCDHAYTDRELYSTDHEHNDYVTYSASRTDTSQENRQNPRPVASGQVRVSRSTVNKQPQKKISPWQWFAICIFIIYWILKSLM